ncbi:hypothetical protein [Planctomicrobium sp. SH664]|uniref:hypothetical protein n=1 Tax=Planctomicrobium sp. SH664 TaxID=3448125 RepID=UPI003F5CA6AD
MIESTFMDQSLRLATGLSLTLALVTLTGCDSEPGVRRQGLGGGAYAPVKVTLLRSDTEAAGGDAGTAGAAAGEKIQSFGTLKGRISVNGTVPALPPLIAQGQAIKDAFCANEAVPDEKVLVGADGGLANVFVYLRKVPNVDVPPAPADPLILDQHGCRFVPHASIIQVGRELKMLNSDPLAHNVKITGFSTSYDSGSIPAGDKVGVEMKYQRPERNPASVTCSFHAWMQGYQLALDHPWGALTDADGAFVIENVPAGKMEFVFWHEKLGYLEKSLAIEIPADGTAEKNIEVTAAALAAP